MASSDVEPDATPMTDNVPRNKCFDRYKYLMDCSLKKDNFEILIISHEDDDKMARKLQSLLMEKVMYFNGEERVRPKVELHRDLIYEDDSPFPELDFSLKKTVFIFLLATASFCADHWTLFEGRVSLDSVFKKDGHEKCFCVVHTKGKDCKDYQLPSILDTAKDVYFLDDDNKDDNFYKNVERMLKSKVNIQRVKDIELHEQRKQFLRKKHPEIFKQLRLSDDHSFESVADVMPCVQESRCDHLNGRESSELNPTSSMICPVRTADTSSSSDEPADEVDTIDDTPVKELNPTDVDDHDVEVDAGHHSTAMTSTMTPYLQQEPGVITRGQGIPDGGVGDAGDVQQQPVPLTSDEHSNCPAFNVRDVRGKEQDEEQDTTYNRRFANISLSTLPPHVNNKESNYVEPDSDSGFNSSGPVNRTS